MASPQGDSSWWQLPLQSCELPPLLVSANFFSSSYTIRLTDLANLWEEGLDRKAICMRGFREDTSIDPSEGPENMESFLSWIEAALTPWHKDHSHTSATISSTKGDDLVLALTCQLPAGLRPLKWPIHLKKMALDRTATDLVLPLIRAQQRSRQEVTSLMEIIDQKDAAMTRLLDKLEGTGTGLDQVFPSLTGKRKVSRETAGERVSGLAPFNQTAWKERMDRGDGSTSDSHAFFQSVFGGKGLSCVSRLELPTSLDLNDWWTKMSGAGAIPIRRLEVKDVATKATPPASKAPDDDDDFQVQATPPHLQESRKRAAPPSTTAQDDESTADETGPDAPDGDLPPPSGRARDSRASGPGAIGRKKRPTPTPPPLVSVAKGNESETASEADDEPTVSHPDASSAPMRKYTIAPKNTGLGRIGGSKPREPSPSSPLASPQLEGRRVQEPAASPSPHKLGAIGKKAIAKSEGDGEAPEGRGRIALTDTDIKQEVERERSQERADRKRAELHRELERRAATGPAKKKRRF